MHEISFKLDAVFFEGLLQRLETERQRANEILSRSGFFGRGLVSSLLFQKQESYPRTTLPTLQHLALLVETAFSTSLQREEGRSLKFTLTYQQPNDNVRDTLTFTPPLGFAVPELIKLAPAAGGPYSAIAVTNAKQIDLEIWGILTSTSSPLKIKVLDPGQIIVSYAGRNVAVISGTEAFYLRDPFLNRSSSIWSLFRPSDQTLDYSPFSDPKVDALLDAVREMHTLAHGGALIIVPNDEQWKESVERPIQYSGEKLFTFMSEDLKWLNQAIEEDGRFSNDAYVFSDALSRSAKALAHLTAVDGAVLITPDLDVIGFGVKLRTGLNLPEPFPINSIDPLDHRNWLVPVSLHKLGGMRHQSAARFVFEQRDAVAFVVSQDRNINAFVWEEHEQEPNRAALWAYRRLELTLF